MNRMPIRLIITIVLTIPIMFLLTTAALAEPEKAAETVGGMELAMIKGGIFVMGDITGLDKTASPAHRVEIKDFYIGKYEVTFEQYDQFCEATKRKKPSDEGWGRGNRPVINVGWNDAVAYTKWLSKKSGRTVRLPTEAEWEYAARGGSQAKYWWGNQLGQKLANCRGCGGLWDGQKTTPVGTFNPNPYGLYDTAGNVYEWCLDSKHIDYQNAPIDGSAWVERKAKKYMSRGGAWFMPPVEMSSYSRSWDPVDTRNNTIGLRLVMEP